MSKEPYAICCFCQEKLDSTVKNLHGSELYSYFCDYYMPIDTLTYIDAAEEKLIFEVLSYMTKHYVCYSCYENPPEITKELFFRIKMGLM